METTERSYTMLEIRSEEACWQSTSLAVSLARETEARLHVAHVTTARELELFTLHDKRITAEACVGHLLFTDADYARLGTRIKVNPSIKTAADREALRKALNTDRFIPLVQIMPLTAWQTRWAVVCVPLRVCR